MDPTRAPSNAGQRRRLRRHLLTTTAEQLDDALLTMNSAIGQNLVSGETNEELNTLMLCDAIMDEKADKGTKSQVLAEMLVMQRGSKVMLNLGGKGSDF